jgi:hypothetical protein
MWNFPFNLVMNLFGKTVWKEVSQIMDWLKFLQRIFPKDDVILNFYFESARSFPYVHKDKSILS